MRKVFFSIATISLLFSGATVVKASETISNENFKQLVCAEIETQDGNKKKALKNIMIQIGRNLDENQRQTLVDIKNSNSAIDELCY